MKRYQTHLSRLRTYRAKKAFADETYYAVAQRYYRLESKNPSFAYTDEEKTNLRNGRAPYPGGEIHHVQTRAQLPERAIDPYNLVFTEGGGRGTPHHELHRRAVGEEMSSRPPAAVRQAVVPAALETEAAAIGERGVDANGVSRKSRATSANAPLAPLEPPAIAVSGEITNPQGEQIVLSGGGPGRQVTAASDKITVPPQRLGAPGGAGAAQLKEGGAMATPCGAYWARLRAMWP